MGKMGTGFLAAIAQKPDQIWKYLARINFKDLTTWEKTQRSYNPLPPFQQESGDWLKSFIGSQWRPLIYIGLIDAARYKDLHSRYRKDSYVKCCHFLIYM